MSTTNSTSTYESISFWKRYARELSLLGILILLILFFWGLGYGLYGNNLLSMGTIQVMTSSAVVIAWDILSL